MNRQDKHVGKIEIARFYMIGLRSHDDSSLRQPNKSVFTSPIASYINTFTHLIDLRTNDLILPITAG